MMCVYIKIKEMPIKKERKDEKMFKKILAAAISLMMCTAAAVPAIAAEEETENSEKYTGINSLGAYNWGANPANQEAFEKWLGRDIQYVLDFFGKENWYSISEPSWLTDTWKKTKFKNKVILSVAIIPDEPADASIERGAEGDYDNYFVTLAQHLVARGMTDVIIRPGWEMNGNWYRWSAKNNREEYFAKYFQHIVTAMKSVKGQNFKFFWNPAYGEQSADAEKCYPGDDYVDYVGIDIYDECWEEDTYPIPDDASEEEKLERWNKAIDFHQTRKYGLNWIADFAKEHEKKIIIGEWGISVRPDQHGGGDDPYFVDMMYDWLSKNEDLIETHVYFNVTAPDGDHQLSGKTKFPESALKFLEYWGEEGNTGTQEVNDLKKLYEEQAAEEAYQREETAKSRLWEKTQNAVVLLLDKPKSIVNNELVPIDEDEMVVPLTKDDRTLVPVRFISESMNADVGWDEETSTVTVNNGKKEVKFIVDEKKYTVDGKESELDVPAVTINDRMMLPLRALSEALDKNVYWNDAGIIVVSDTEDILAGDDENIYVNLLSDYITTETLPNPKTLRKIIDPVEAVVQEKSQGKKAPIGKVSASDEPEIQNNAQNVLDGDTATRWVAQGKQWLQAELKTTAMLNCVGIGFYKGDKKKYKFAIQVSKDGKAWDTVTEGTSEGTTDKMVYYYFPEISAKYVRYVGYGSDVDDWNGISLFNVYKRE